MCSTDTCGEPDGWTDEKEERRGKARYSGRSGKAAPRSASSADSSRHRRGQRPRCPRGSPPQASESLSARSSGNAFQRAHSLECSLLVSAGRPAESPSTPDGTYSNFRGSARSNVHSELGNRVSAGESLPALDLNRGPVCRTGDGVFLAITEMYGRMGYPFDAFRCPPIRRGLAERIRA